MEKNDLQELRETFRVRMQEADFCIGEEQVERLFRELLGEAEPVREVRQPGKGITSEMVSKIYGELMEKRSKNTWAGDMLLKELNR